MVKHTPGPWRTYYERGRGWSIVSSDRFVANAGNPMSIPTRQDEADARLIAAAPEMMEALRDCAAWAEDLAYELGDRIAEVIGESNRIELAEAADKARALIAHIDGYKVDGRE